MLSLTCHTQADMLDAAPIPGGTQELLPGEDFAAELHVFIGSPWPVNMITSLARMASTSPT